MSRKDYVLLAEAIKDEKFHLTHRDLTDAERAAGVSTLQNFAERLAGRLADQNYRFDTARFITACGF